MTETVPPPVGKTTYFTPVFVDSEGHARMGGTLGDARPPARNCTAVRS